MSTIITKNSATSGSVPSSLIQGELAINVTDGNLFYGSGSGNEVKQFGVTSSYALNALTASYAISASYEINYETSSSYADYALSASNALTASYVQNAQTASFITASGVYGPYGSNSVISASYALNALSASYAQTASYVQNAVSASYALNGGVTQLLAGPNVTLSPTNGLGQVTVSATLSGSTIFNTATGSYGSFYDTTTQTNPVANIARSMSFNSTDITNGVSISGSTSPFNTYIKTTNAGVYDIQFSAQVDKTDGGTDDIVIWLRKNGIDLTDTATTLTLPTNNSKVVAAWNWFVTSAANDYYQIIWRSDDNDLRLLAEPISVDHPGIPSVILTVNRVDQFLSNTGSFSGSFTGVFTGSLQGTASFATSASFASTVPASGVIGLNLSQIATASFTASVSPTQFTVTSASVTEFTVTGTGVTIGNAITDTHRVTGSLNMSGSLDVNGTGIYRNVLTIQKTGNTQGILLQVNPSGDFYSPHIQFKGTSGLLNTISLDYNNLVIGASANNYVGFGTVGQAGEYPVTINSYAYGVNAAPNNFVQRITQTANNAVGLVIKNQTSFSPTPTGNFLEFRNASNTVLSAITSGGSFLIGTSTTSSLRLDVSGSTRIQGDTTITGSLTVVTGSAVELQVTNTGVTIGNAIIDTHRVTGSLNMSGSLNVISSITTTGSFFSSNLTGSGDRILLASSIGQVTASTQTIISAYIDPLGTAALLLNNTASWDINGEYTGTGITGTFQGQNHYNSNYFFTAVDDNDWIRLIRG
jgi:hypothetical protein